MSRFLNEKFRSLEAYTPGEQPRDMKYIKLNTNESPFPPSEAVLDAVNTDEVSKLRLYPDPEGKELKCALAELYGVNKENVFISNGSDEILNFSFMAFFDKKGVLFPSISYGFYKVYADLYALDYKMVDLCEDFSINYKDYVGASRNVVIANPNAPTGMTITLDEIEEIVKSNPDNIVLIDEAYVDFGGESCIPLTKKYDNLLVTQTFSKSRNLAGARIAFACGNRELIQDLETLRNSRNPYNVTRASQMLGIAAIKDVEYFKKCTDTIIQTRAWTVEELSKLGFTGPESHTNFVFVKHETLSGEEVYRKLREHGILVRHFNSVLISDYNRITVGTMAEMKALIEALADITKE